MVKTLDEALNVLNRAGIVTEKRSRATQEPISAVMKWSHELWKHKITFNLKSFQSSIQEAFSKGATEIYSYRGFNGSSPRGCMWWLALKAYVYLEEGSCGSGSILILDDTKFRNSIKLKEGEIPSLESIIEYGTDISNWYARTSSFDLNDTKDGRKYNVIKTILELAGENYKRVNLNRRVIRILNSTLKPTKAEEITDEDVRSAIEEAHKHFTEKNHNYAQMMRALQAVGFTDMKTLDYGVMNDYGEKYIGQTIGKFKGNPVLLDTCQSAFENCNVYSRESRVITQERFDELNNKYREFKR